MQSFLKDETLKLGGKELKVTTDMTYKDLINKINDGDYGVSAIPEIKFSCDLEKRNRWTD